MNNYIQILAFVIIGTVLLWFGYSLFFSGGVRAVSGKRRRRRRPRGVGFPGMPQACPVCSAVLEPGELVQSSVYPSLNGGKDRLMHIRGCAYCLHGDRPRVCPVCGKALRGSDVLIARMFERPRRRPHVHVLGCSRCRK